MTSAEEEGFARLRPVAPKSASTRVWSLTAGGLVLMACIALAAVASRGSSQAGQLGELGASQWAPVPPAPYQQMYEQAPSFAAKYALGVQQKQMQVSGPPQMLDDPPPPPQEPPAEAEPPKAEAAPKAEPPKATAPEPPKAAPPQAPPQAAVTAPPKAPPKAAVQPPPVPPAPAKPRSNGMTKPNDFANIGRVHGGKTYAQAGGMGSAGPTSAAEGADETLEDYQKVKVERRQAMDFCDAKFHSWTNIQKCIHLLFKNAHY